MADPVRCLVLSVDIGAGHRRAAEALCEALITLRPDSRYQVIEALEHTGPDGGRLAKELYFGVLEDAPGLWGALYEGREAVSLFRPIGEMVDSVRIRKLLPIVKAFGPDVILAMHPIACGLAGALSRTGEIDCPMVAVLTDFDAHPAWVAKGIDRYLVSSTSVAEQLEQHIGRSSADVCVTGLPIRPVFEHIRSRSATDARRAFGLDEGRFTILLLGGGLGLGPIGETAEALTTSLSGPVQVVVVAGNNSELEQAVTSLDAPFPLHVTGLVENMHEYMAAADLAIGKPGGLTCAELLAVGVPLVALAPIPGQEEANSEMLVKQGVAVQAATAEAACNVVSMLLLAPAERERMRQAALTLGQPGAAREAAIRTLSVIDNWSVLKANRPAPTVGSTMMNQVNRVVDEAEDAISWSSLEKKIKDVETGVDSALDLLKKKLF